MLTTHLRCGGWLCTEQLFAQQRYDGPARLKATGSSLSMHLHPSNSTQYLKLRLVLLNEPERQCFSSTPEHVELESTNHISVYQRNEAFAMQVAFAQLACVLAFVGEKWSYGCCSHANEP